jgi:hypothetical protein
MGAYSNPETAIDTQSGQYYRNLQENIVSSTVGAINTWAAKAAENKKNNEALKLKVGEEESALYRNLSSTQQQNPTVNFEELYRPQIKRYAELRTGILNGTSTDPSKDRMEADKIFASVGNIKNSLVDLSSEGFDDKYSKMGGAGGYATKENDPNFINLIQSDFPYNNWGHPNLNISPFWGKSTDEDTIYVRFDDDVVFVAEGTIEAIVNFRIKNPQYLFIYPFTVNNSQHSRNLQDRGLVSTQHGWVRTEEELFGQGIYDPVGLLSPSFVRELHLTLFKHHSENTINQLMTPEPIIWKYGSQISINCICWFGSFMKTITPLQEGKWPVDEENYLTTQAPKDLNMPLCTIPNTLISHFLFGPQRSQGEMEDLLEIYKQIANA